MRLHDIPVGVLSVPFQRFLLRRIRLISQVRTHVRLQWSSVFRIQSWVIERKT
jgi:hypothetical protein